MACNTGYSGSVTATCQSNRSWSYEGSCNRVTNWCNSRPAASNANTGVTRGYIGQAVTMACNTGYSGSVTATCGSNGSWSYAGSCMLRGCHYLGLTNGRWSWQR